MIDGRLDQHVVVDALQGGAGTSTNMNVNEVLANRALQLLGRPLGDYQTVNPHDDLNLHQSTNDTYPTALRVAAIFALHDLERNVVALMEAFQEKEKQLADVVKIGRTELQDAVLMTLGREMAAYAEAIGRDRWRIYKCEERLRVVNLGGTAIGTGLGAPRQYIFRVVEHLREITGLGLARAENLIEATQNADALVEVSGILRTLAVNLLKIANDLRLLSSGPHAGLGEIRLPPRQAGSSIMPGKVNPVIPEAVAQAAIAVMGHDQMILQAVGGGNLELSQFLPLVADSLLTSIDLLTDACDIFARHCVVGHRGRRGSLPPQRPQQHRAADRAGRQDRLRRGRADCPRSGRQPLRPAKHPPIGDRPRPADGRGVRRVDLARAGDETWFELAKSQVRYVAHRTCSGTDSDVQSLVYVQFMVVLLEGLRMNQPYAELFRLTLPERLQLVEDLWDSIAVEAESLPLSDWQKAELDRRDAEYRQNPSLASTWEEAKQRILARHGQ